MGQGGVVFYFLMGRNTQQGFGIDKGTGVISEHGAVLRDPEQVHPDGAGQEPGQQRGQRHRRGPGDHPGAGRQPSSPVVPRPGQAPSCPLLWSEWRTLQRAGLGPTLCLTLHSDEKPSKEEESLKGRMSVSTDPCSLSSLSSLTQSAWGYFERQNSSFKSTY